MIWLEALWVMREQVPVYQALWEQGELTVRSRLMLVSQAATLEKSMAIIEGFGVRSDFGDDSLKLWGLKFGLDGGAEGGALDEPYVNNPGYRGHLLWNPDDLLTLANFAVRRGWKVGTHAIGDCAVRTLLDVYEQVIQVNPSLSPGTLVLEHGFLADATQRSLSSRRQARHPAPAGALEGGIHHVPSPYHPSAVQYADEGTMSVVVADFHPTMRLDTRRQLWECLVHRAVQKLFSLRVVNFARERQRPSTASLRGRNLLGCTLAPLGPSLVHQSS